MKSEREKFDDIYAKRQRLGDRYRLDNPGNRFNFERLRTTILDRLQYAGVDLSRIKAVDIGCGSLFWTEELVRLGIRRANCLGVDLLHWRLREGHEQGRNIQAINASVSSLPIASESVDLVCQFTLMTSLTDMAARGRAANEVKRILKPGGYILWYDFRYNNPANPHTRAIGRSAIGELFDGWHVDMRSITLIPHIARKIPSAMSPVLKFLHRLPILRSHYVALIGPKG